MFISWVLKLQSINQASNQSINQPQFVRPTAQTKYYISNYQELRKRNKFYF